jgi:hypothetical protein
MMRRTERIRIAFFKGDKSEWHHRFVRWWSKSPYSHAEIVLSDGQTWVSISPFLYTRVAARVRTHVSESDWDYLDFMITESELNALRDFISETTGDGYDWPGMLLSQVLPFIIKGKGRWYCSSWIAHALSHAGIVKWKRLGIYEFPDLHPGRLYDILSQIACLPIEDTESA